MACIPGLTKYKKKKKKKTFKIMQKLKTIATRPRPRHLFEGVVQSWIHLSYTVCFFTCIITCFEVGVLLLYATLVIGTKTFASGK